MKFALRSSKLQLELKFQESMEVSDVGDVNFEDFNHLQNIQPKLDFIFFGTKFL